MAKINDNTKVVTNEVRFSYVHVFEPQGYTENDKKYSVSILIDKKDKDTIEVVKKAIENAKKAGITKLGGKIPANLKTPLRDGDTERSEDEAYANCYFLNATCKTKPSILYRNGNTLTDSTDFYSGCYGFASINFYAFSFNGNKGIACGLNNLMKSKDGDFLGGRSRAEDDFADLIEEDDDDLGF